MGDSEGDSVTSERSYYGFVDGCNCGAEVKKVTSEFAPNIGRLFYRCDKLNEDPTHCSQWWDTAVEDEIDCVKSRIHRMDHQLAMVRKTNIPSLQDQLDAIEDIHQVVLREELDLLKTTVEKLKTDVECSSAGFDKLVDYYKSRTLKDLLLGALENMKSNACILGLTFTLTVSLAAHVYLYVN